MSDYEAITLKAQDGVTLFYRDYAADARGTVPVVCLPGLTRSSTDFADLAQRLATRRRVICPDLRGRGRSGWAPDPATYMPAHEMNDTLALLASAGVHRAVFIGTSRGGLITMLTAVTRPTILAGAVLNDIGPVIEAAGLARIMAYAGQVAAVETWEAAADQTRALNESQFPDLGPQDWSDFARRLYVEREGRPVLAYDPAIGAATRRAGANQAGPAPDLWPAFGALAAIPTATIRGALSDILSAETVARMAEVKPDLIVATVPRRGHAPLLDEAEALAAIDEVLARADAAA